MSRANTGVQAAFCVTEGGTVVHQWACTLDENNSLFQTQLFVILTALEWIEKYPDLLRISIFSDSLYGLQFIHTPKTKNTSDQSKIKISPTQNTFWPCFRAQGHSRQWVRWPTLQTGHYKINIYTLPVLLSFIKRVLKSRILTEWHEYW